MSARSICSLAVAVIAVGCAVERDHPFHTVAVYEAPRGQYSIRIEAGGIVRAGADMSRGASGVLTVSPLNGSGPAARPRLSLEVALRGSRLEFGGDLLNDGSGAEPDTLVVSRLLSDGGYPVYPDELDEIVSAIEGVLLGPKGTLMAGQSRVLKVVSTTFDR